MKGTVMCSAVLLYAILIHGVYGTFFPPVNNPPPVPAQAFRTLPDSSQGFYMKEDFQDPPVPNVRDEDLFQFELKPDDQRWYFQENESREAREAPSSTESFDRYYQSGEPAIGPVATPIPDDTYLAQPSSISKLNPTNTGSDIWILTRGSESQYNPERWAQVPAERFIEVINQDSGPSVATDVVESISVPVASEVPVKTQFSSSSLANIVQQLLVRRPSGIGPQTTIIENAPSVKQIVDTYPSNMKQIGQQNTITVVPAPPAAPQIVTKNSFTLPPPPPPPLKGIGTASKIVPSVPDNVISDVNIVVAGKNIPDSSGLISGKNILQQVRHIWIPTSSRTGKFITIPVSESINSEKPVINKGILGSTPVTVSDTWVLKEDGLITSFEKQQSSLPPVTPPVVQNEKVGWQNPPLVEIDEPPNPPIGTKFDSPINQPVIAKSVGSNVPLDIWPVRREVTSSKVLGKSPASLILESPVPPPKSDNVIIDTSFPVPSTTQQKAVLRNGKSPVPSLFTQPALSVINGKPCPTSPPVTQKSLFPLRNPSIVPVPRVIAFHRRQPFARIFRVNRYPSSSYYLLNRNISPNYYAYLNPSLIQRSKTGLNRLVQTQQIPLQIQGKQPLPPVQKKQIAIPVQSKQLASPTFAKQVSIPVATRQILLPVSSPKSTPFAYPTFQAIRYAYPLDAFLRSSPVPGKGVYVSQLSPFKLASSGTNSDSSSSESSSSEDSSESTKEDKEKLKKEEKPQNEESTSSDEREKESNSEEPEKENSNTTEVESEESMETAESQIHLTQASIPTPPRKVQLTYQQLTE